MSTDSSKTREGEEVHYVAPYNRGTPMGKPDYKYINVVRAHDTEVACNSYYQLGKRVTITKNPYSQEGSVIHLTDDEARDLFKWLEERYGSDGE